MKLEPLFKTQNNKLLKLSDNSEISLENLKVYNHLNFASTPILEPYFAIEIPWSLIELSDEMYNEELLASLREILKNAEEKNQFAFIIPLIDKDFSTEEQKEAFINACNHTARRIKDCISVIGFEFAEQLISEGLCSDFVEVLSKKHAQYLYFAKKIFSEKLSALPDVVLY